MENANIKKKGTVSAKYSGSALVVDDNSVNLIVAANILKKYGLEVAKASSGEEALEILSNVSFDMLFLDLKMPGMGGDEVLKHLRSEPEKYPQEMAIVLLTAAEAGELEQLTGGLMEEYGVSGYLGKPIDRLKLEEILEASLGKKAENDKEEGRLSLEDLKAFAQAMDLKHYREGEAMLKHILVSPASMTERQVLSQIEEAYRDFDFQQVSSLVKGILCEQK
ncbi:MAG: response regulator [Lachnospiraceae bacterium]|nr:response regulator [Lachnospiraceae bacterium]